METPPPNRRYEANDEHSMPPVVSYEWFMLPGC
jgi:hypothetical protein